MAFLPDRTHDERARSGESGRQERRFRFLDVGASLAAPPAVVQPIATAYRRFLSERDDCPVSLSLRLESEDASFVFVDDRPVPLLRGSDAVHQVYQLFVGTVFDRVGSHAMLHAAALADVNDGALLLAGSSGRGKTSLALELVSRGMGFLSDDHAPLDLVARTVSPYPRTVGVLPQGGAPLPERFRDAARAAPVTLFGKSLVDVGDVLGEQAIVRDSLPLRHVIVLAGSSPDDTDPPSASLLEIACRAEGSERIGESFGAIEGLDVLQRRDAPEMTMWTVRVRHELQPTRHLSRILDDEAIISSQKFWDSPPEFDAEPRVVPIKRREAAECLARELLNRRESGRLLHRYRESLTAFFLDLAGALREATCWKLAPGRYGETADLVQRLIDGEG